jgi:hypothetical protein
MVVVFNAVSLMLALLRMPAASFAKYESYEAKIGVTSTYRPIAASHRRMLLAIPARGVLGAAASSTKR